MLRYIRMLPKERCFNAMRQYRPQEADDRSSG